MSEQQPDPTDRGLSALRRIILATLPAIRFFSPWEYRVVTTHADNTCDLTCADQTSGMPDLKSVATRSGVPGATVTPAVGSLCVVTFVNGDPSRYRITDGFDSTDAQAVVFQGGPLGVARGGTTAGAPVGDTIIAGYVVLTSLGVPSPGFAGDWLTSPPIYPGTAAGFVAATAAAAGIGGSVFTLVGTIATGSSTVRSG